MMCVCVFRHLYSIHNKSISRRILERVSIVPLSPANRILRLKADKQTEAQHKVKSIMVNRPPNNPNQPSLHPIGVTPEGYPRCQTFRA